MSLTQINKAGLDELALDHVFTIGASGTDHYTFQGEGLNGTVNDPTLYLTRGKTYRFENGSGGHPIRIQSTSGASGTAYNTGVTNNAGSGTVIVEVQHDAPDVLYYQCTSHANMNGILYITGALADSGVTTAKLAADAVTGAKIADDAINSEHYTDGSIDTAHIADNAVTQGKIPANAIGTAQLRAAEVTTAKIAADAVNGTKIADDSINSEHYVDGSIDTAHIADQAVDLTKLPHGTSSNDGKFLRANNGADPTFETVTGTTINNNADNRVITGSGTANTLNGESTFVYDTSENAVGIGTSSPTPTASYYQGACLHIHQAASGGSVGAQVHLTNDYGGSAAGDGSQVSHYNNHLYINNQETGDTYFYNAGSSNFTIKADGKVGVGTQSPSQELHVNGDIQASSIFLGGTTSANQLDDYEEGTFTPAVVNGWGILGGSGGGTGNASVEEGKYVRVGDIVHLYFSFKDGGSGGSFNGNTLLFYGLPFAPETDSQWGNSGQKSQILNAFSDVNASGGGEGLFCAVAQYGNTSLAMRRRVNGGTSAYTGTNLGSSGQVFVTGTYRAA